MTPAAPAVDPATALLGALALGAAAAVLLWPRRGLVWRWVRLRQLDERVLVEDAVKHIYHCEERQQTATVESLSGALGISCDRAAALVERLVERDLARDAGTEYRLTPDGTDSALHVIRVHRLWERHLAERTGVDPAQWHREAHHWEHRLSPEEVETLAAQMGHPTFDPHGDPIPTAQGELPRVQGRPLSALAAGERGAIAHIEDEPDAVYAQLVAEGLHPGMEIHVAHSTPTQVRFWAGGGEHVLAPLLAANVTVAELERPPRPEEVAERDTLASLEPGERASVTRLSRACRGLERRRLMDLGIVPGTSVSVAMRSPGGDPTAYRVRGAMVALRREQARQVLVERPPQEAPHG
ncbi:MAG: FeoA domain-containing protein [Gemmatimonadota bacterium]